MNNELSTITKQTMSSLEIAKLTGKEHPKVTADIRRILEEAGIEASGFRLSCKMPSGQTAETYNLPYLPIYKTHSEAFGSVNTYHVDCLCILFSEKGG